jgi:hypothetical protein
MLTSSYLLVQINCFLYRNKTLFSYKTTYLYEQVYCNDPSPSGGSIGYSMLAPPPFLVIFTASCMSRFINHLKSDKHKIKASNFTEINAL